MSYSSLDTRRSLLYKADAPTPAKAAVSPAANNVTTPSAARVPPPAARVPRPAAPARAPVPAPAEPPAPVPAPAPAPGVVDDEYAPTAASGASFYIVTAWGLQKTDDPQEAAVGVNTASVLGEDVAATLATVKQNLQAALNVNVGNEPLMSPLWQALLISSCALAAVFLFHIILRAAAIKRKMRIPTLLLWPVPELILLAALLPILVSAAAPLLSSSGVHLFVGIMFGILIPFTYMFWMIYVVKTHVVPHNIDSRQAVFVIAEEKRSRENGETEKNGETDSSENESAGSSPVHSPLAAETAEIPKADLVSENESQSQAEAENEAPVTRRQYMPAVVTRTYASVRKWVGFIFQKLMRYFFGLSALPEGKWMSTDHYSVPFVARFGALFQSSRGPPVKLIEGTYEFDRAVGRTDRGVVVPTEYDSPELKLIGAHTSPKFLHFLHSAQAFSGVWALSKMFMAALIMNGMSANSNINPKVIVFLMLMITLLEWMYVRILTPFESSEDLIIASLWAICDTGTYTCGMIAAFTSTTEVNKL